MNDDGSSVITQRVCSRTKEHGAMDIESDGNDGLNLESDLMMADAIGEAMSLQPSILNARATKIFTGGDGAPRRSQEGAIMTVPTLWLIKLAKESVSELFYIIGKRCNAAGARCWTRRRPASSTSSRRWTKKTLSTRSGHCSKRRRRQGRRRRRRAGAVGSAAPRPSAAPWRDAACCRRWSPRSHGGRPTLRAP